MDRLKIFSGRSNRPLAEKIVKELKIPLEALHIKDFADGETWAKYEKNIRGADVFIIQSTNSPAKNVIELFIMLDAVKRAAAQRITAVIPYFGYGRQDRKDESRTPITAKLMAKLIEEAGANGILTIDLHTAQIQGFFEIPVNHLYGRSVFLPSFKGLDLKNLVIVAPDMGASKLNQSYANKLGVPLAVIDKRRHGDDDTEVMNLVGEVKNRDALIIDDMFTTGTTTLQAVQALLEAGAKSVSAGATHGVLPGKAVERINKSRLKKVFVTDTIHHPPSKLGKKIEVVSVAPLFAEAIRRIHNDESVSSLFE